MRSEYAFLEDFMDARRQLGLPGCCLVNLQVALHYLLNLDE